MKIIRFLKTDVKIINSYFLIAIILVILISVGYSSYALFSFTKTSNNIIELTVGELKKADLNDLIKLADNKNDSGLYKVTHNADSTLQIGATESITEYRYRGANPKNYVTFNNEVWRIIGIFKTDDGTGNIENRIKLIRNESIGTYYWDSNGYNNWTKATLQTELNETYYNSLSSIAKSMIGDAKYYLGGYASAGVTVVNMYSYERKISGSDYYYSSNPTNWTGKLGLMYISDYGYASDACENKKLYTINGDTNVISTCNTTNWLYNVVQEWLLNQWSGVRTHAFQKYNNSGMIHNSRTELGNFGVRPVLYLKPDVKITGGDGTSTNPYILGL